MVKEKTIKQEEDIVTETDPIDPTPAGMPKPPAIKSQPQEEKMVPLSSVKKLIAEAMAEMAEKDKPAKVKRVTEHHAHAFRLNGKWIVDFADRNYDYEKKEKIDPYIKEKIHAYNQFNQQKREFEAWIKIVYDDGTMEDLPLNRYVERRTLVYLPIINREKVDKSYSIGEVEKKKEVGELNKGTGIMIDQEVQMDAEIFHLKTPEGGTLILPDYVIC